jgi:glutamate N-acetyltransferase / amino-acid N-acetyltransferase
VAVGLSTELPVLHPVPGIRAGAVAAGIRKKDRLDLVLLEAAPGSVGAAVFTQNAFCAAPVILARRHLEKSPPRYLLINAGNANAGTGDPGLRAAGECCALVAALGGCDSAAVLPFSTGVIGEPLPVERIEAAAGRLFRSLDESGWALAARGIMTTDTVPKAVSTRFRLGDATITLNGIAKGAGMIHPDMATMLAFLATDARVAPALLQRCLADAVDDSFNAITVDGDTSTNDACVLIATGAAAMATIESEQDPRWPAFRAAVREACARLAQMVVRDGEGATRFITVDVEGGRDRAECRAVAYAVALSPLVKTAFFAGDPNWGRILAAVGRAGLAELDVGKVSIRLDDVSIVSNGARAAEYSEEQGQAVMCRDEITIRITLGRGQAAARVWTTDLSYDYVKINAEYRT